MTYPTAVVGNCFDLRTSQHPRAYLSASYDIVSTHSTLVAEAEVIQTIGG